MNAAPPDSPSGDSLSSAAPANNQSSSSKRVWVGTGMALLLVAIGSSIGYYFYTNTHRVRETVNPKPPASLQTTGSLDTENPRFAEFHEKPITITPAVPQYTLAFSELANASAVGEAASLLLDKNKQAALAQPGFFITPGINMLANGDSEIDFSHGGVVDEFVMHYAAIAGNTAAEKRKPENTVFITSDYLLHVFHVFLDRTFQYVEQTEFQPKLLQLTTMLFDTSLAEYQNTSESKLKHSFGRLVVFFLVPKVYLETTMTPNLEHFSANPKEELQQSDADQQVDSETNILATLEKYKDALPSTLYETAKAEVTLTSQAKTTVPPPLYGTFKPEELEDYTQYKPRSHYEKNSVLRSYWKAMIWYGRNGLTTKSDELTLDATIMASLLANTSTNNQSALQLWKDIYLPTVFFVGKSDDLSVYDFMPVLNTVYGDQFQYADLVDAAKFTQLKQEIEDLPGPLIQSSIVAVSSDETKQEALEKTKSFRLMGQRFIPDSYMFSSLTQGDEAPDTETGQQLPTTPTALMVMKLMGSKRADTHVQTWIQDAWPNSDRVLAKEMGKLDTQFSGLTKSDWTQNLYWSWLYTLQSLFTEFPSGYPRFMQTAAWNDKDLHTGLGSWTELRHDTLLYAKQSYAEMGGAPGEIPTPPPVPKGYVEPNLTFLNRIIALAEMTRDGLQANNVLPDGQKYKLEELIKQFTFYRDIAEKELQNTIISDDDFEKLRVSHIYVNGTLTPPDGGSYMPAKEARAGLIADVHTAASQRKSEILYEATGIPNMLYVAVKDANGTRLTRGVTYSYYEFTRPLGERLSDTDWQGVLYENQPSFPPPSSPEWYDALAK